MKNANTPKIGLCLSGGGSRAMAFHLGCLKASHKHGVLSKVSLISTVSGGSVIGAMYAYSNDSFEEFTARVTQQLASGFHKNRFFDIHKSITASVPFKVEELVKVFDERLYQGKKLSAETRDGIEIVINACELSTHTAFRFSNKIISNWMLGKASAESVSVAEAVAISAAHPAFFRTMNRKFRFTKDGVRRKREVFLTDGGVYENLGITPIFPDRAAEYSYPHDDFDYIIACDAEDSEEIQLKKRIMGIFDTVDKFKACFATVMRRVRSMNFKVLHEYKNRGAIKGFVLANLSYEDTKIFSADDQFVSYAKVAEYPTDFCGMTPENIKLLSDRGEQITDRLLKRYLNELL